MAFITTIHKKDDRSLPSNNRSISLARTACKIMESIINDRLVCYLFSKGLISRQHRAFIKKHKTVTNYYNVRTTGHSLSMVGILWILSILTLHVPSTALFILSSSLNLALLISQETS